MRIVEGGGGGGEGGGGEGVRGGWGEEYKVTVVPATILANDITCSSV